MSDETKVIDVLLGPYRNQRLTVSAADAESAVNNHWATDPDAAPDEHPHPPLSDEERQAAYEAANDWATTQWAIAQGEPEAPPPPEGEAGGEPVSRDMEGDEPGKYTTRSARPLRARR